MSMFSEIANWYGEYVWRKIDAEITGVPIPDMPPGMKEFMDHVTALADQHELCDLYCPTCGHQMVFFYPNRDEYNYKCAECNNWFQM